MTVNAQTMLELADDIADIPQEVNLTPRQARLLQAAANALRETAALPPSQEVAAPPQRMSREALARAWLRGTWEDRDVKYFEEIQHHPEWMAALAGADAILALSRPERCTPHE